MHAPVPILLLAAALAAQEQARAPTPSWRDANWGTDQASARSQARARATLILAYFPAAPGDASTGDFEARVLADRRFPTAVGDVVRLVVDPAGDNVGRDLATGMGVDELPGLLLLDAAGTVQARLDPHDCSVEDLRRTVEATRAHVELTATLAQLPAAEAATHAGDLLVAEAEVWKYPFVELDKRMQALGARLSKSQRERLRPFHVELECRWLCQQTDMPAAERRARCLKLLRDGRLPSGRIRTRFWIWYGETGIAARDPLLIDTALEALANAPDVPDDVRMRFRTEAAELRRQP